MGFSWLPTKVRNDPLGTGYLTGLRNNMQYLLSFAGVQHNLVTGEHNTNIVPRRVLSGNYGVGWTVAPINADYSLGVGHNPLPGILLITLASGRFSPVMCPQINLKDDAVINGPCMATFASSGFTNMTVFLQMLSSGLGAGNSWIPAQLSFDIAIHADAIAPSSGPAADMSASLRGDYFTEDAAKWNAHVQAQADHEAALEAAHFSTGGHAVREVGKVYAHVTQVAGVYSVASSTAGAGVSVTSPGTGICEVDYNALTAPTCAFVSGVTDGDPASIFNANANHSSPTTHHTVYLYKYDPIAMSWDRADADFWIVIHGD